MRRSQKAPVFLDDATPVQLLQAVASNHRTWFARNARVSGGELRRDHGLVVSHKPGPNGEMTIAFPHLRTQTAGKQLDAVLRDCYERDDIREVAVWALREQTSPPDLGIQLIARGFEQGWRPHWMWLDLQQFVDVPVPDAVRIEVVESETNWDGEDLPYYDHESAHQLYAMSQTRPRRLWHFAAWIDEQPVGQSVLHLTTGRRGVAGIFTVSVATGRRGQGIGKAVTSAALRFARDLGCRYALLNATEMGEPLYHSLGFTSLGFGQTWWLHQEVIAQGPPTDQEVAFAEAVGRGDSAVLAARARELPPETLDTVLRCGLTPVQLAVQAGQPGAVEWLVEHGATLDILSAWDLGWKDRGAHLLATNPELANRLLGRQQRTPLHEAVLRDDAELARLVLSAHPNLEIADAAFHSTALGWARHLGRDKLMRMIEQANPAGDSGGFLP